MHAQSQTCVIRQHILVSGLVSCCRRPLPLLHRCLFSGRQNTRLDAEVVVQDGDEGGDEGEEAEKGGDGGQVDGKMREDVELILAALVDFRRDMKALNKKVQQITDNDGHKNLHTLSKHNPGFLE